MEPKELKVLLVLVHKERLEHKVSKVFKVLLVPKESKGYKV